MFESLDKFKPSLDRQAQYAWGTLRDRRPLAEQNWPASRWADIAPVDGLSRDPCTTNGIGPREWIEDFYWGFIPQARPHYVSVGDVLMPSASPDPSASTSIL